MGYSPLFLEDARDRALILLRAVPVPLLRRWTLRAKVYVDRGHHGFLRGLLRSLRWCGVAHVKLNDERHGLTLGVPGWPQIAPTSRHVFVIDIAGRTDDELCNAMHAPVPRNLRRAAREGVEVTEIHTEEDLAAFNLLVAETHERMRSRRVAAVYPERFFRGVFDHMVPRGQALFLLARVRGVPVAGQMYLVSRERLIYYHGGSTRDRALTACHGPSAAFWHAIRLARDRGIAAFDFGGATPTNDPADVHFSVTDFKRRWGGRHVAVQNADIVLARTRVAFQERIKPLWSRVHPLYLRVFGRLAGVVLTPLVA